MCDIERKKIYIFDVSLDIYYSVGGWKKVTAMREKFCNLKVQIIIRVVYEKILPLFVIFNFWVTERT